MNIINGKEVSKATREKVAVMVKEFIAEKGRIPCLAVILVGEDPASQTYVKNKIIGCEEVGMKLFKHSPIVGIGIGSYRTFSMFTNVLLNMGIVRNSFTFIYLICNFKSII